MDEALLDERREPVARDVLNVRLAAVQRGDDVLYHVDEEGTAVRLGKCGGQRHADVASADYGDVVLSHARQG